MSTPEILRGAAALSALGFSEIEALVYCFLLRESPATGYRVSHAIGKPTANTYKAITALAARGAVTVDDGDNRLCRAVPPGELLGRLERGFLVQRRVAEEALKEIHHDEADDRIYRLATVEQVLDRARDMLKRAEALVLVDAFTGPLGGIREAVRAAVRRKVKVAIQVYDASTFPGALLLRNNRTPEVISHWPGQHFCLVVDAREHLLALLSQDMARVHQAIWSQSHFLSCLQHNHLASDLMMTALETLPEGDPLREEMAGLSLLRSEPLGLRDLRRRLGGWAP